MEKKQIPNNEIEIRSIVSNLRVEERSDEKTGRVISGYAAKFDTWSDPIYGWFKEKIARGAFDKTDMSDVIMVFNHDISGILARTTSGTLTLSVDETGLRFEFEAPDTTLGNDMVELVRRGTSPSAPSSSWWRATSGCMPTIRTRWNWTSAPSSLSPSSTMCPL